MKRNQHIKPNTLQCLLIILTFVFSCIVTFPVYAQNNKPYIEYKGKVIDETSGEPLVFATITIEGSNIATVTNSEGEFILKIPKDIKNRNILISYIGYKDKEIPMSMLSPNKAKIKLEMLSVSLSEINVFPKDANLLIKAVLARRNDNYMQDGLLMTAFYRETIKKRRTYASLAEAVVQIYKQPYRTMNYDHLKLLKERKSADYDKLDTLIFKLMGGPYNPVILDIMKTPYMIISYETLDDFNFELSNITRIGDRLVYVISFTQKAGSMQPLFYGKLYIDSESLAVTSASFHINTKYKDEISRLFIKKKPAGAKVYITNASYMVNYREKDGVWYYGYSRGELSFKVNWAKKLFNTVYSTQFEMAVTDWEKTGLRSPIKPKDRIKMNIIMRDEKIGFMDRDFWGSYNVIEPEKPIENAIRKIRKNLEKLKAEEEK